MVESELGGVKFHFTGVPAISVEGVSDDGNAEAFFVGGMDAKLMSAAGDGVEGDAGEAVFEAEIFPMAGAHLAMDLVVDLMGTIFDVEAEGESDGAFFF